MNYIKYLGPYFWYLIHCKIVCMTMTSQHLTTKHILVCEVQVKQNEKANLTDNQVAMIEMKGTSIRT